MPTKQQLETALINADKSGDYEAAKALANALKAGNYSDTDAQKEATPVAEVVEQEPSVSQIVSNMFTGDDRMTAQQEALPEIQQSGLLSGESTTKAAMITPALMTATDPSEIVDIVTSNFPNVGVTYNKDAKGDVYPVLRNNETGAVAQVNKPGLSALDIVQGLGIASAYTPAGRAAGITGTVVRSLATESALQAFQAGVGGDFNTEDVALSGAVGGAGKALESGIGSAYRFAKGSLDNELVDTASKQGIPLMTSDVLPPKTFVGKTAQQTAEKIPLAGTGGLREGQQELRMQAVSDIADKYGQFSYSDIVSSLRSKKDSIKNRAGNILSSTGTKLDSVGDVNIGSTLSAIEDAKLELGKSGVIKSSGAMDDLNKLIEAFEEAPQTFTTLKENRTAFRDIIEGADKADRSQLPSRAKALLTKVAASMSKDMDAHAKANLSPKEYQSWKKANAIYADEASKLKSTKLKSVLDKGDVTPENVQSLLFSQKPSEVEMLYNSLTPSGRSNARSAIISKVVENLSRRQGGVTPNAFANEMKNFGLQTKTFFKGEEAKQLNGLIKLLDATKRAQEASLTTPTGQQVLGAGYMAAAATDLGATLGLSGTVGGIARLYESAPVRNALLRLGSVPRGSSQFEKALREAYVIMNAGAQSARSQAEE